jgi:hypothetical protein
MGKSTIRDTGFNDDLEERGKPGERVIAKFFESIGYTIGEDTNNSDYDFDITKDGDTKKIEVKADSRCIDSTVNGIKYTNDTGNIFIEFTSWNRPAGIETTKADVYAYLFEKLNPRHVWFIPVDKLKKLIEDNKDLKVTSDSGDEGSATQGYLVPRKKFFKLFSVYKENKYGTWEKQKNPL